MRKAILAVPRNFYGALKIIWIVVSLAGLVVIVFGTVGKGNYRHLNLSAMDPLVRTSVGVKRPLTGIVSTGKAGPLLYGPNIPFAKGKYKAIIYGQLPQQTMPVGYFDIAIESTHGALSTVIAKQSIRVPKYTTGSTKQEDTPIGSLEFTLPESIVSLELRAFVTAKAKVVISRYTITKVKQ